MQQHVVAKCIIAEATLEVLQHKRYIVWPGITGSSDNEEPDWRDLPVEELD